MRSVLEPQNPQNHRVVVHCEELEPEIHLLDSSWVGWVGFFSGGF